MDASYFEDWGLIDYAEATSRQKKRAEEIASGDSKETVVICSHPPVVTLGRGTKPGDLFSWKGETVEVSRGGRATYHGPSQVVMYPLFKISGDSQIRKELPEKDLHAYMRAMEESVIEALKEFGISSAGRSQQTQVGEENSEWATGVWVKEKKIASIGIAVKKWVVYHGISFNLKDDPEAFHGIHPCGFRTEQMTSLEMELGRSVAREDWCQVWLQRLQF